MYFRVVATAARQNASPPIFLRSAGHPVRWGLLRELALSDRRVRELCSLLGQPQNLVSYHLARLRSEQLVSARQSAADRRDTYYTLDLDRCGELLAAAGGALHPGLRLAAPARPASARSLRPVRILFLCTGNGARSRIAEALVRDLSGGAINAVSAGSRPKPLHPNAVRVMRERGIDTGGRQSRHVDEFAGQSFDYVISLCDRVREVCPDFPGHPNLIHWSIPDPAREGGSDDETCHAFERTATELATRIPFLLALTQHTRSIAEVN
jgi:ArsR family transcriptional regulator, arsenate/arsenite/antimonite-responsive transcriptional repressor / arsenate reductase (thioredoxin)